MNTNKFNYRDIKMYRDDEEYMKARQGMIESRIDKYELAEMRQSRDKLVVIDLRENPPKPDADDFIKRTVEGDSINITMENLVDEVLNEKIPDKDTTIVLVCFGSFSMCRRISLTSYAYPTLKLMGYENLHILNNWMPKGEQRFY